MKYLWTAIAAIALALGLALGLVPSAYAYISTVGVVAVAPQWILEENGQLYTAILDESGAFDIYPAHYRECTATEQRDADSIDGHSMNHVFSGVVSADGSIDGYWLVCATISQTWVPNPAHLVYLNDHQIAVQLLPLYSLPARTLTLDLVR